MSRINREGETGGPSSLRTRSISGLLWTMSRSGGMVGLRFLMLVVLARLLTPEEFGVMSAALVVLGFSSMFYMLGVGPALVQRPEVTAAHIRVGLTASVGLSLMFGTGVAFGAPLISALFDIDGLTQVLMILALEFPFQGISVVARSLMQRELRFKELAVIDVSSYAFGYGAVGVTFAALGAGVWALVYAHLARSAVATIMLIARGRYGLRPGFNVRAFKELMIYGGGFTLARVFNYMARQGDNFVAARWLGAGALGVYGRAYQLVVFPINQLTQVISEVLFPAMARIQASTDRLSSAFRRGATVMALVFAPLGVISAVLAPEIINVFLGSRWLEAVAPFQVLAVGMLFRAGYQMSDTLVQATGAVYRTAWRQATYAVAVVTGALIGQNWGLVGLAFGILGALILHFALMSHLSVSQTSLTWSQFAKAHLPGLELAAIALVITVAMSTWLRSLDALDLATLAATGIITLLSLGLLVYLRPSVLGRDHAWILAVTKEIVSRISRRRSSAESASTPDAPSSNDMDE